MKKLVFLMLFMGSVFASQAQSNYNTGIGIALGSPSGLNVKHFVNDNAAIQGIAGWYFNNYKSSVGLTALYQIHRVAFDVPDLLWYYGLGGHVGVATWDNDDDDPNNDNESTAWIGIDLCIGLEYTIPNAPINFSLELVPGINLLPGTEPGIGADLGIRYVFK